MRKYILWMVIIGSGCVATALPAPARAANWFNLQGISNPAWGQAKWTFWLQPVYASRSGSDVMVGDRPYPIRPNLIGPGFSSSQRLTMFRARAMLRGSLTSNITYFLGAEFGDDGYNYSDGHYTPHIIDAHLTFSNYIPGTRIEVGNIRAPGPEEAMQGYVAYDFYDVFPTVTGQLMQTTFYDKGATYQVNPSTHAYMVPNANLSSTNGFRYPGVEVFDWFPVQKNIEFSYGVMLAGYGKMFESDSFNGSIVAGRAQVSYLLGGGKGAFRNDLTGFVWYQHANPTINGTSSTMRRDGLGITYRNGFMKKGGLNVKAEYMEGRGNIAVPAPFVEAAGLKPAQYETTIYAGSNNKASGYYLLGGVFVSRNVELTVRYDRYDRLPNLPAQERVFNNLGLGVQYHMTAQTKIVVDYFFRNLEIPHVDALGPLGSPQRTTAMNVKNSFGNAFNVWGILTF